MKIPCHWTTIYWCCSIPKVMSNPCFFSRKKTCVESGANLETIPVGYKRLQILRFYWSNTGLYTGILHRRFTGAIHRTNFPVANPVALLLQEISLGSTGNLHRFWTRRGTGSATIHRRRPPHSLALDDGIQVAHSTQPISGSCIRSPILASSFALLSAPSLPASPWCPLTHISRLGRSAILKVLVL